MYVKLYFGLKNCKLTGYPDADFFGDYDDKNSISSHIFLFGRELFHDREKERLYI